MAKPNQIAIQYTGSYSIVGGESYPATSFALGNVLQMKTKDVKVSIDKTPDFPISYDDLAYVNTGSAYRFNKDCIIAVGQMTLVV